MASEKHVPQMTNSDLVLVPRSVAREALVAIMGEISERCYAAGWMSGTEIAVWLLAARGGGERYAWDVGAEEARSVMQLADALGEWPADDGWMPLGEWKARMEGADARW